MRVLLVTPPGLGHLHPLLPLAEALRAAGHSAVFATTRNFVSKVEATGFAAMSVGHREGQDPVHLFDTVVVENLLRVADEFEPEVMLHDHTTSVAAIVADLRDIPNVYSSVGIMRPPWMMESIQRFTAPIWASFGLDQPPCAGLHRYLYLDRCPRSLQPPDIGDIATAHPIRPITHEGAEELSAGLADWLRAPRDSPLLYVTLGTVFNSESTLRAAIDALATEPVALLVAVGHGVEPRALGTQPPNVRVEQYVPQAAVLDACDAVVCHAGSGTILQALTRGLPLVLLPQGADQVWNAPMCEQRGVALTLEAETMSRGALQDSVRRILHVESYRMAAGEVAEEIRAMPGLDRAVQLIERVSQTDSPVLRGDD